MALITLAEVVTLAAAPAVQTYIANRPGLFAELEAGGMKGERLNADQHGNLIGSGDPLAVPPVPPTPVVPSTPYVPA